MWNESAQHIEDRHQQLVQAAGDQIQSMWEKDLKGRMKEIVQAVYALLNYQSGWISPYRIHISAQRDLLTVRDVGNLLCTR